MKYRILMYSLLVGITLTMTGCQKEQEQEVVAFDDIKPEEPEPIIIRDEDAQLEEETTEEITSEVETEEEVIAYCDLETVAYDVTEEIYEEGNVKVSYPQLINMEDTELMDAMNERIRQTVIPEGLEDNAACLVYDVSYEIATQGTGILSVVFRGYEEYDQAAHPSQFAKTLNLRLSNGENVRLKEYADLETIVTDLELAQGYTILSEEVDAADFSAFLNNGYVTDYAITLLDYDVDFTQDLAVSGYSYIKDNQAVLCIQTEHVMGDYAEVSFSEPLTKGEN